MPGGPTYLSSPDAEREPGAVAEAVAPNDALSGEPRDGLGSPRTMPASNNPNAAALNFVLRAFNGQKPTSMRGSWPDMFIADMPDGSYITFRPADQASSQTSPTTATVEINDPTISALNGNRVLKLKFPRN